MSEPEGKLTESATAIKHQDYVARTLNARVGKGFHNCAGFVKYLIGLSDSDGFVRTGDPTEKGLIKHLVMIDHLPLKDFSTGRWEERSLASDVVGILSHKDQDWRYLHFMVPSPDPDHCLDVFHRNGFEKEKPEITSIIEVIKEYEPKDCVLVFLRKKGLT